MSFSGPPQLLLSSHSTTITPSVSVSPLVIFEILDHFKHRNVDKNQRVLGSLLGTERKSSQYHKESFFNQNFKSASIVGI